MSAGRGSAFPLAAFALLRRERGRPPQRARPRSSAACTPRGGRSRQARALASVGAPRHQLDDADERQRIEADERALLVRLRASKPPVCDRPVEHAHAPQKGSVENRASIWSMLAAPLPFALPAIISVRPVELAVSMWQPPPPCGGPPSAAAIGTLQSALVAAASATTNPAFAARAFLTLLTSLVDYADVTSATASPKGGNPSTLEAGSP